MRLRHEENHNFGEANGAPVINKSNMMSLRNKLHLKYRGIDKKCKKLLFSLIGIIIRRGKCRAQRKSPKLDSINVILARERRLNTRVNAALLAWRQCRHRRLNYLLPRKPEITAAGLSATRYWSAVKERQRVIVAIARLETSFFIVTAVEKKLYL